MSAKVGSVVIFEISISSNKETHGEIPERETSEGEMSKMSRRGVRKTSVHLW